MIPAYSKDDPGTCPMREEVFSSGSVTFTGAGKRMRDIFAPLVKSRKPHLFCHSRENGSQVFSRVSGPPLSRG